MSNNAIDAKMLSKMFLSGARNLDAKKEWINELNVFPVPDGDTGTNMTMTIMSAAREVQSLSDPSDLEAVCKAISSGYVGYSTTDLYHGGSATCEKLSSSTFAVHYESIGRTVTDIFTINEGGKIAFVKRIESPNRL